MRLSSQVIVVFIELTIRTTHDTAMPPKKKEFNQLTLQKPYQLLPFFKEHTNLQFAYGGIWLPKYQI